ncbi:hypothetical protein SAMN05216184_11188 [Georgenia satyanarayanai]|uniref:Uncharacterized protein n=1 Tax=Georgenia satyanarayanai TaxID=860221 RepID=A0A2Y9AKU7_9MICO|nr:hypothetical protein [Georgenia satyanarayanai]PYF98431.1 hypothetical protein A8987_11188 [Georgenia satyanarayanai]SSA45091.1 hypothetical protein SAMN05216184_11188 [Georgenia satyanarayanai]
MRTTNGALDRAADRLMALGSASYGDERERAVFMAATTFGYMVTTYVSIAVALVAALFGQLLLPVVVLLLVGLPSWSAIWYSGRRGVDVTELAFRAEPRIKRTVGALTFGGFALVLAALAVTVFTGHGLLELPALDTSGALGSMVKGGVVGGAGGLLVAAVAMAVQNHRRTRGGAPAQEDTPEED